MGTVYVAHCIDTEGPLCETLSATFERVKDAFGIDLPATPENLAKLQNEQIPLDGKEAAVAKMLAPTLLNYNDTWAKLGDMLDDIMSTEYRKQFKDSEGNPWVYSWFCLDHVGYEKNPRKRDIGYHNIFDAYVERVTEGGTHSLEDAIDDVQFHYHPMPFSKQANHCATHFFAHSDSLFQILSRRIIDKGWFPSCYRPGFHTIRPDSNWFLEQFIPFDFSNQACSDEVDQPDLADGRFGDWRRAPANWQPYHPDHDDYQIAGNSRRWTFRCLNVGTRLRCLTAEDVDRAFAEAGNGKPVVLSFTNHDFRDMRPDVEYVYGLLKQASEKYPNVPFKFCKAKDAAQLALQYPQTDHPNIQVRFEGATVHIETEFPIFGPQPFFCFKTKSGQYYHDNMDIHVPFSQWSYTFDVQNGELDTVKTVGVACASKSGNVSVTTMPCR